MLFGLTKKATNKVKKTKLDATLMKTKTLPQAKEDHSKDKDKEEKNWKVYKFATHTLDIPSGALGLPGYRQFPLYS